MKSRALWKISVITTPEASDAVAELCQSILSQPAVSWTDAESGEVMVSVYSPRLRASFRPTLARGLAYIRRCRLNPGAGRISFEKIRRQDWAESWKRHFKPIRIGSTLLIKPGWSKQRAGKNQAVVVLDPGLSFGTGHHPTTAFCLQQVALRRIRDRQQSFLDIGTGSGILAIAAAKLGYGPVKALDFDRDAVRIARANARKNRVFHKIRIRHQDITRLPLRNAGHHDLICANLISTLLLQERKRILRLLKPGGVLVISGILTSEFQKVQRSYERLGLTLVASQATAEWRSGVFV